VQLGAQQICDRGEADEQHPDGIDGSFALWSVRLKQRLLEEYPLPEGLEPIPDDVLLDPKWLLEFVDPTTTPSQSVNSEAAAALSAEDIGPESPPTDLLNVTNGLTAKILSNERVTPKTHWQDVRHITFNITGYHPYTPGDILTVYPKNFPSDINEFISIMNWTAIADTPLQFIPSASSSRTAPLPIPNLPSSGIVTIRTLLTNHLDIMSIPRRSFFAQLLHFTNDEFHRDRLHEFIDPEYVDELYDYTTRPRRSILEVLQEFESVKIPWQRICSIIPAMRGRQFSIASAISPSAEAECQTRIELLIAIVKYRTVIKRIRQGVCTRYIASLLPGQEIGVTLQKGALGVTQKQAAVPVIMIGPGTGVAPMRSLIYQRIHWGLESWAEGAGAKDMLFFGCRNAEADFFFKDEWEKLKQDGVSLDVCVAFSRDQREKVYVQDLVRRESARVYDALANKGGFAYICGSSGKMPQAVREALIETFQAHGDTDREGAEAYLVGMEKSGRYKQETW
jgi:sulfite reductase alpha subunit-like flavoprotein